MACKTYNKGILVRQQNISGVFFKKMLEMIKTDPRVCFVTSDALMEQGILRKAMSEYPDRIIDVGIAEQNMIGIASGLALAGKIPFVSAMAPFLPLRALDQIYTDIAYNDVPVKLISTSAGTVSGGGPTHNLICDFAILNSIPNMAVIAPSDINQFVKILEMLVDYPKPAYLRMPQADGQKIYSLRDEFIIGKANVLSDGNDAAVIAIGRCVAQALVVAQKLEKEDTHLKVIDMYTIKPLDREVILQAAETKKIIIMEDHNICGGLGTLVSSVVAEEGLVCDIFKLGIPDEFSVLGTGKDIAQYYGFDADAIIQIMHCQREDKTASKTFERSL